MHRAAVRLDRLIYRIDRYKSHDGFLKKCFENKGLHHCPASIVETEYRQPRQALSQKIPRNASQVIGGYTTKYCKDKIADFKTNQEKNVRSLLAGATK